MLELIRTMVNKKMLLHTHSPFRIFGFSIFITIFAILFVWLNMGAAAIVITLILILVEITFSFENAVINAKVLSKMSKIWQTIFLTVGIVIAIFGVRIILPIIIVAIATDLPWQQIVDMAIHDPMQYAEKLELAHPSISAFGAGFLLMLTLAFFLDSKRQIFWINRIEKPLQKLAKPWAPAALGALIIMLWSLLPINKHPEETLYAGLIGIATFFIISIVTTLLNIAHDSSAVQSGMLASMMGFIYLEILDASFSLDSVIGAFAVTSQILLIAIGLGIGAFWVRSITVYMVRKKTLNSYKYLEHGAHYTVAILTAALLISLFYNIPTYLPGLIGIGVIITSVISSTRQFVFKK